MCSVFKNLYTYKVLITIWAFMFKFAKSKNFIAKGLKLCVSITPKDDYLVRKNSIL